MTAEQQQLDALAALRGKVGRHFDLANDLQDLGFKVRPDKENNERSEIVLRGVCNSDGSDCVVGEILGDSEARIV